jgi:hypothetical protein
VLTTIFRIPDKIICSCFNREIDRTSKMLSSIDSSLSSLLSSRV